MKVKKILAGFLSAAMIFSMIPATAFATETDDSGNTSGASTSVVEEHEHVYKTDLSEDGTKLIYTCTEDGCSETYEEEYVADTPSPTSEEGEDGGVVTGDEAYVAQIGEGESAQKYESLAAAIAEVNGSATITLLADTTESITIPENMNITLALNNHKLINEAGKDTITVALNGTLTVTGSGTVDNVSHQCAAIVNNGTTKLSGGSYTRSAEASTSTEDANGNSYYNILNHGQMTIEEGVSVTSSGAFSSLIDNGYYNYSGSADPRISYVEGVNQKYPTLVIDGGSFSGGINTIKNDDAATVTINKGTFSNVTQAVVFNCNKAVITGGIFAAEGDGIYAVNNQNYNSGVNVVTAEISGGTFNGTVYNNEVAKMTISGGTFRNTITSVKSDNISISGGSFSTEISADYCAEGYELGEKNSDGMYSVQKSKVAEISEKMYETLDEAIEDVQPGETITLLADVTLADDTPAKIIDKGTAESSITLDLNGHNISGSNSKNGTTESTTTPGGILWIYGSYVTLTDSSKGDKGGIVNTYNGSSTAFGLVVKSTANNVGAVTISYGVKIDVTKSTSTSAKAIYFQNNTNSNGTLTLTIEDAEVTANKGLTLYASAGSGYSCMATINGGEFNSTDKENNTGNFSGSAATMTINGGTFYNWGNTDWNEVEKDHVICISQPEGSERFIVTITENAPDDNVAYVGKTDVYRAICLTEGSDLYLIHSVQTPASRTIHVKKNVAYRFPEGKYYGYEYSSDPGNYKLTLDLAQGVTLSGGMALYSADVTVTGDGKLAENFLWTPAEGYKMTANGEENGLYSCRLTTGAGATLIKDGTEINYKTVINAIAAAKLNPGSTVKMLADYTNNSQVTLYEYNGVVPDFTLDLNGHTYTYSGVKDAITVDDSAKLTVTDSSENGGGAIVTKGARDTWIANSAIATTGTGGTIVIKEGVTVKNLILLDASGSELTVAGTVDTTGFETYAISGNGSDGKGGTKIVIEDTAVITSDSTVAAPAIYHPQSGTLTVEGGTIRGYGGIQMCSGDLIISGNPTITASGSDDTANKTGDGGIPDGAAISIVNRGYPGGEPTLTITGSPTVTAATGVDAVQAYTWSNNTESVWDEVGTYVNISGGSFSTKVPEAYCAEGYEPTTEVDPGTNKYSVQKVKVARIGETKYETLADAITAAQDNDTITLLANVALDTSAVISKTVTLDLNGHSITRGDGNTTSYLIGVASTGALTVEDTAEGGSIDSAAGYGILTNGTVVIQSGTVSGYYGVYVSGAGAKATVSGGTVSGQFYGIFDYIGTVEVIGGSVAAPYGIVLKSASDGTATANISGGTVSGTNTAIEIRANRAALGEGETLDTKEAYTSVVNLSGSAEVTGGSYGITLWGKGAELNVSDSAKVTAPYFAISGNGTYNGNSNESGTTINITGGTITATGDTGTGIYHPQAGTLTISGGTISGATGVEMRAGELTVSDGSTIKGTGNPLASDPNGGGTTTVGAGIAVVEHTTKLGVKVTISGGEISGYNALYQKDLQSSGNEDVILSVTDGSFTSTDTSESAEALSTQVTGYVSGGSFSSQVPANYCATGYVPTTTTGSNGMYTVETAKYDVVLYSALDGGTVTSVANMSGGQSGIAHGKDVTIHADTPTGYVFLGWYKVTDMTPDSSGNVSAVKYDSTPYSKNADYTFEATEDITLVALYSAEGNVKLSVYGWNFTLNDVKQSGYVLNKPYKVGDTITLAYGEGDFQYWTNGSDKIVSRSDSYTFTIVADTVIKLNCYSADTENTARVEFVSYYDQLMQAYTWSADDSSAKLPDGPSRFGYVFQGWGFAENGAEPTTVVAVNDILQKIKDGEKYITLRPVYMSTEKTYSVAVYADDKQNTDYAQTMEEGKVLTVTAPTIESKTFSYWTDENGTILSYSETYSICVSHDITLKAVYDMADVTAVPTIVMTNAYARTVDKIMKVSFEATRNIPEEYTLVEHGMLYSTNRYFPNTAPDETQLTLEEVDGATIKKALSNDMGTTGIFTTNVSVNSAERIIYARGYMVVKDSEDNIVTYYTGITSGSYNSLN